MSSCSSWHSSCACQAEGASSQRSGRSDGENEEEKRKRRKRRKRSTKRRRRRVRQRRRGEGGGGGGGGPRANPEAGLRSPLKSQPANRQRERRKDGREGSAGPAPLAAVFRQPSGRRRLRHRRVTHTNKKSNRLCGKPSAPRFQQRAQKPPPEKNTGFHTLQTMLLPRDHTLRTPVTNKKNKHEDANHQQGSFRLVTPRARKNTMFARSQPSQAHTRSTRPHKATHKVTQDPQTSPANSHELTRSSQKAKHPPLFPEANKKKQSTLVNEPDSRACTHCNAAARAGGCSPPPRHSRRTRSGP